VLTAAIAQVPAAHRRKLLIRADGAGVSHQLPEWITALDAKRGRSVQYSVGYAVTDIVRDAIARVPKKAWQPAITAQGEPWEYGDVVELTGMLDLTTWPAGMRVLVRREHPTPARLCPCSSTPTAGATKPSPRTPPSRKAGRSRSSKRATARTPCTNRVESRIRHAKDWRLGRFPSREYAINQAWTIATSIAADLVPWLRLRACRRR